MYSRKSEAAASGKTYVRRLEMPDYLIDFNDLEKCDNEADVFLSTRVTEKEK
jgi:hypothetical protein